MTDTGEWDWTESTPCRGDDRFTGREPDQETADELEEICLNCDQFVRCSLWAVEYDAVGVFAAGIYRDCIPLKDGFETDPKFAALEELDCSTE